MAPIEKQEVNDVERVEIEPSDDDELIDDPNNVKPDASSDSSKDESQKTADESDPDEKSEESSEKPDEEPDGEGKDKEELRGRAVGQDGDKDGVRDGDLKAVEGETPRERALRFEVTRLKRINRFHKRDELFGKDAPPPVTKKELSPEKKKLLERYNAEEVQGLREVLDVIGEDIGFVRKDEFQATTYQHSASGQLDAFLDEHQEYMPENDKDNLLWSQFKAEFELYRRPEDPKDFKKIFTKIHRDIFGVQPASGLRKINAQQEKIKVASHSGASAGKGSARSSAPVLDPGLKSHLKGFSEAEMKELFGE